MILHGFISEWDVRASKMSYLTLLHMLVFLAGVESLRIVGNSTGQIYVCSLAHYGKRYYAFSTPTIRDFRREKEQMVSPAVGMSRFNRGKCVYAYNDGGSYLEVIVTDNDSGPSPAVTALYPCFIVVQDMDTIQAEIILNGNLLDANGIRQIREETFNISSFYNKFNYVPPAVLNGQLFQSLWYLDGPAGYNGGSQTVSRYKKITSLMNNRLPGGNVYQGRQPIGDVPFCQGISVEKVLIPGVYATFFNSGANRDSAEVRGADLGAAHGSNFAYNAPPYYGTNVLGLVGCLGNYSAGSRLVGVAQGGGAYDDGNAQEPAYLSGGPAGSRQVIKDLRNSGILRSNGVSGEAYNDAEAGAAGHIVLVGGGFYGSAAGYRNGNYVGGGRVDGHIDASRLREIRDDDSSASSDDGEKKSNKDDDKDKSDDEDDGSEKKKSKSGAAPSCVCIYLAALIPLLINLL